MTPAALTAVSYDHRTGGLARDHQVGCQLDVASAFHITSPTTC